MNILPTLTAAVLLGSSLAAAARPQTAPAVLSAPAATPLAPVAPASTPAQPAEPQVLHQVSEDDHVRIEELRVRGQTQRLVVQPKIPGMPAYEIVPPTPGKAPSQDAKSGQRVWLSLPLSF